MGRSRNRRAPEPVLLCVEFRAVRDAQHPPHQRAAVRARDGDAVDDGIVHRGGLAGDGLSHHDQHRRAEHRISRDVRALRTARQWRAARSDPLLDPDRDEQPAGRSHWVDAVQPPVRDRAWPRLPRLYRVALLDDRTRSVEAPVAQTRQARSPRCPRCRDCSGDGRRRCGRPRRASVSLGPIPRPAAGRGAPGADQPRLDRARPVRGRQLRRRAVARAIDLWHDRASDARRDDQHDPRQLFRSAADDRRVLRRRTGVARARPQAERDPRFDPGAELGDDRAQDHRHLRRAAGGQSCRARDRPRLSADPGRPRNWHCPVSRLVHLSRGDRRIADRGARGGDAGAQPQ